jgi:hypothetical protein
MNGEITMESEKKKKGFLATIWESMTKTGGCCGGGEGCCGPDTEKDKETTDTASTTESGTR